MEKDLLWDKIKTYPDWKNELKADIRVEKTDVYGYHTVVAGDTLSKIARNCLGDASLYPKIFEANRDKLDNPDMIKVGQTLTIPNRG
jgi:nucleoid-associated protein YgaU